ncbi:MAG: hypothetical protein ACRCY9_08920, partial [Phycicoccus sp.]
SLGMKRGRGRGSFIDSVLAGVDTFYGSVLGDLKAWSATPPRLRPERPAISVEEGVRLSASSTDVSSQDGPSPAGGADAADALADSGRVADASTASG